jgi:hypothetical protein
MFLVVPVLYETLAKHILNTVTALFIDNDWQMKGYVLQTRKMDESHTGENLAVMLNAAINEWRLVKFNTKPSLTTDMLLTL